MLGNPAMAHGAEFVNLWGRLARMPSISATLPATKVTAVPIQSIREAPRNTTGDASSRRASVLQDLDDRPVPQRSTHP
jgi:hypothetical protein